MKLSPDENDDLENLLLSGGWLVFVKILNELTCDQEKRVLTYDLGTGLEGLGHAKARAEGARKLMHSIQQLKTVYLKDNKAK